MQRRIQAWGLTLVLVLVGLLGAVRPAAAQTGGLPTVVQPPSARFELHGDIKVSISSGGSSAGWLLVMLSGSGAQAGANLQEDLTTAVQFPGLNTPAAPSEPFTSTTSTILVDGKYYTRSTSGGTGEAGQWYVTDLSTMPGGGANMSNPVAGLVGIDPTQAGLYAGALTVQPVGKETVSGGATTKYQIDVDVPKLYAALGVTETAETTQLLQSTKLVLYMWVGDADSYLYQLQMTLNAQATDAETKEVISEALDLMITYRDFGAAITIVAPPNALPLPTAESGAGEAAIPVGIGAVLPGMATMAPMPGMPTVMPMPVNEPPVIAPPPATPIPGMPRSGTADPTGALVLLALGLLCVASGALARRRSTAAR